MKYILISFILSKVRSIILVQRNNILFLILYYIHNSTRHWQRLRRDDPQAPAAAAMAWNAARGSSKRAGRAPTPPALRRPRRGPRRPRAARPGRPRGGRGLGSVRIRARRRPCTGFTEGAPRVRSRRCFRHGGTESLSDFGMKRMGGGAESGDVAELRTHRGPSQTAGRARRPAPRRRQRLRARRPGAGGGAPQLTSRGLYITSMSEHRHCPLSHTVPRRIIAWEAA